MNLDQHLTREADVHANIVAAQLSRLESQSAYLSSRGRQVLELAFARFLAATRDPIESTQEVTNG
jgi:hypothetical protein